MEIKWKNVAAVLFIIVVMIFIIMYWGMYRQNIVHVYSLYTDEDRYGIWNVSTLYTSILPCW